MRGSLFIGLVFAIGLSNAQAQDLDALTAEARALSASLVQRLGGALKKELADKGPVGAVQVCKSLAPEIASELSSKHGMKVSRVSLKPRNPMLGLPDAWEQQVLATFDSKAAAGDKPDTLEHAAIVDEPAGKFFRYMKALAVQPLCLTCHGDAQSIPAEVKAQLAKDYPADRAIDYTAGQIRGAVTIKKPL
jgi:Protein of unknown function (DUF3365)